jgi:hypothetical protein
LPSKRARRRLDSSASRVSASVGVTVSGKVVGTADIATPAIDQPVPVHRPTESYPQTKQTQYPKHPKRNSGAAGRTPQIACTRQAGGWWDNRRDAAYSPELNVPPVRYSRRTAQSCPFGHWKLDLEPCPNRRLCRQRKTGEPRALGRPCCLQTILTLGGIVVQAGWSGGRQGACQSLGQPVT